MDEKARVKRYLDRLNAASNEEERWRKECEKIERLYRDELQPSDDVARDQKSENSWNMLASNSNILMPAIYNSPPIPDIRRRFNDQGPVEKEAAAVLERAVGIELEDDSWHDAVGEAVNEVVLYGRGVVRMRYKPEFAPLDKTEQSSADDVKPGESLPQTTAERIAWQRCPLECIPYSDFRRGPGKKWAHVKWVAFRHLVTREEAIRMFGRDKGEMVALSHRISGCIDEKPGEYMMRGEVWEIWDKPTRKVVFVSMDALDVVLMEQDDPLKLMGFFPVPKPIYGDSTNNSLVPLTDYRLYRKQAEELELISERIRRVAAVIKWRGGYDKAMTGIAAIVEAADGKLEPVDTATPDKTLADGIWLWPIEQAVAVLQHLVEHRRDLKEQIYEIIGLWDIIRGNTDPNETLGAQELKSQWGSMRVQRRQAAVARLCCDLLRMQSECIAEHYDPMVLSLMTGIQVTPEIKQLISTDQMRAWRIDIETDSTIRADMNNQISNVSQFVQGVGTFVQAFAPAVQSGICPPDVAVDLLAAFANIFKLGRSADMALQRWTEQTAQMAQMPKQPSPEEQANQQKAQLDQQKLQVEASRVQIDAQKAQHEMAMSEQQALHDRAMAERDMSLRENEAEMEYMKQYSGQMEQTMQMLQVAVESLQQTAQAMAMAAQSMSAPRQSVIVRDAQGRAVGAQSVVAQKPQDGMMQ